MSEEWKKEYERNIERIEAGESFPYQIRDFIQFYLDSTGSLLCEINKHLGTPKGESFIEFIPSKKLINLLVKELRKVDREFSEIIAWGAERNEDIR